MKFKAICDIFLIIEMPVLHQGIGVGGQLRVLNMYKAMGESHPVVAPSLRVGDVLVFTKCTVHSCSGIIIRP